MKGLRVLVWGLAAQGLAACAADLPPADAVKLTFNGTATVGTMVRTEDPDPAVYGILSSARVGLPPGQLKGNSGANDFNFQTGRPISTVVKTVLDWELKRRDAGVFVRAKAWYDNELKNGNRAYGNAPNNFTQGVPLSDAGFEPEAKFSNAMWADVYVFDRFELDAGRQLDVRLGRQVVSWGVLQFLAAGVNAINPADTPAQLRPGALAQETKVPVGMLYMKLAAGQGWGLEGLVPYEFRRNVLTPCGTFFATSNIVPGGCNYGTILGNPPYNVDDAQAMATGQYVHRGPDVNAKDGGEYGLSLRFQAPGSATEWRGYAMNYHSRTGSMRFTNANIAGGYGDPLSVSTLNRLTDPNGVKFSVVYPENIELYGLSFLHALSPTAKVYGELVYRPNQPLNLSYPDMTQAFVFRSATGALNLAKGVLAIAPGGSFDGYDRFKVSTLGLGASQSGAELWSARSWSLNAELGWSHVDGLPDRSVLHYGRSDLLGTGPVSGQTCTDTSAAQKSCSTDGFVSPDAWGYRLRMALVYPDAGWGAQWTPSLTLSHDVQGYSFDGSLMEGRKVVRLGLRADWGKKYFLDLQYNAIFGGVYNTQVDRDYAALALGMTF